MIFNVNCRFAVMRLCYRIAYEYLKRIMRMGYHSARSHLYLGLIILISVLFVYGQIRSYDFISFDDGQYVTENSVVKQGLSVNNIIWAFTSFEAANWHPLAWVSHMVDVELYGLDAGHHHLTSLMIHIVNSFLLFYLINMMTCALWPSFFVAAIFALHPMHVESVVWVSERKDVLCAFFWFLTMICYVQYVKKKKIRGLVLVIFCFILGLMSKPMIVTLPFVLVLMDIWPLGRINYGQVMAKEKFAAITLSKSLIEKIPLFLLSFTCVIMTLNAQKYGGAIVSVSEYSSMLRSFNIVMGYVKYIQMMFWPSSQSVLYPRAEYVSLLSFVPSLMGLILVTVASVIKFKEKPYFTIGWLWFLGTLVPVVGFVQAGMQGLADRYTYIPYIGLSFLPIWFLAEWASQEKKKQRICSIVGCLCIFAMMLKAHKEVGFWENGISLYTHAINSTKDNYVVYRFLGNDYMAFGMYDEAFTCYNKSLEINSHYLSGLIDLGNAYSKTSKNELAVDVYIKALNIFPGSEKIHNNLGVAFAKQGALDKAIAHFQIALSIKNDYQDAKQNLKKALSLQKD